MFGIKRALLFTILLFVVTNITFAGSKKSKYAVQLTTDYKKLSGNEYDLIFKVTLKKGQYVKANNDYDSLQKLKMPVFTFDKNSLYTTIGETTSKGLIETKKLKHKGIVNLYSYTVLYNQKVSAPPGTIISGTYTYRVCTEKSAKRSRTEKFSIIVK